VNLRRPAILHYDSWAAVLPDFAGKSELDRLERYERRALSRRKQAIEIFMAISHTPQSPPPGWLQALRVAPL
jgi:hypothetical protein